MRRKRAFRAGDPDASWLGDRPAAREAVRRDGDDRAAPEAGYGAGDGAGNPAAGREAVRRDGDLTDRNEPEPRERIKSPRLRLELLVLAGSLIFLGAAALKPWAWTPTRTPRPLPAGTLGAATAPPQAVSTDPLVNLPDLRGILLDGSQVPYRPRIPFALPSGVRLGPGLPPPPQPW